MNDKMHSFECGANAATQTATEITPVPVLAPLYRRTERSGTLAVGTSRIGLDGAVSGGTGGARPGAGGTGAGGG